MGKFIINGKDHDSRERAKRLARATGQARRAARAAGSKREARRAFDATLKAHGYNKIGR